MSGRSSHVRKKKAEVSKAGFGYLDHNDNLATKKSSSIDLDTSEIHRMSDGGEHSISEYQPAGYARVKKPQVPIIDKSGIDRSAFRQKLDKASDTSRNKLSSWFQKKNKLSDEDGGTPPQTPISELPAEEVHTYFDGSHAVAQNLGHTARGIHHNKLPSFPGAPRILLWRRGRENPTIWDGLNRDVDLWDLKGDTLVFFSMEEDDEESPPPSFRCSSHVIEIIESPLLTQLLQDGLVYREVEEREKRFGSPRQEPEMDYRANPFRPNNPTPPGSETSRGCEEQISYRVRLPKAGNVSKPDKMRHKLALRNVLALFYGVGIVGASFYQALLDVHEKLDQLRMRRTEDVVTSVIVGWLIEHRYDDMRDDPNIACSILLWSEHKSVRWEEGWKESFVHCAGMYNQVSALPIFKTVSAKTRMLLEAASFSTSQKVAACEKLLAEFNYTAYWPGTQDTSPASSRGAFIRLQTFFCDYYRGVCENWPPVPPESRNVDGWLTRIMVKDLAADFNALYDFLVDRRILWDGSVEYNNRRWNIVLPGNRDFSPSGNGCDFTDYVENFDSEHAFPHIPHPYPKLPGSHRVGKGRVTQMEARRFALAYTEATNVFELGDDFVCNDMVEAYMDWEKKDKIGEIDPRDARRARWVLIYFITQTLASLSVDTPNLRYKDNVEYFLAPSLAKTPPWEAQKPESFQQAEHNQSHCWTVRSTWSQSYNSRGQAPASRFEELPSDIAKLSSVSSFESSPQTPTFSEAETMTPKEDEAARNSASDGEFAYSKMQPDLSIRTRAPPQIRSQPSAAQLRTKPSISLFPTPPGQQLQQYARGPVVLQNEHQDQPTPVRSRQTPYESPRVKPPQFEPPQYPAPNPPRLKTANLPIEISGLRVLKPSSPDSPSFSSPLMSPVITSPLRQPTAAQLSSSGYAPGIEKLENPIWVPPRSVDREHKPVHRRGVPIQGSLQIRDFDDEP